MKFTTSKYMSQSLSSCLVNIPVASSKEEHAGTKGQVDRIADEG
jgi:hypothetical protein